MTHPPLLVMSGIDKAFAGVSALRGAALSVAAGEVHALIGQNGAGKSTLLKILTGAYRRDAGTVRLDGRDVNFSTPLQAQQAGIATIYQEVNLVRLQSVAENVMLGHETRRFGLIDWRGTRARAADVLRGMGIELDVTRPLGSYSLALQQMVAIARALVLNARLVVMDEPTSSLDDHEVERLFTVIRQLQAQGVAVIFVSHRLDELYAVCTHITVMRDGQTVYQGELGPLSRLNLVSSMLGRQEQELAVAGQTGFERGTPGDETLLTVEDLRAAPHLHGVSLSVRRGEVTGLAGLLGSGRSETARAIFAADPSSGTVTLGGQAGRWTNPAQAIRAGLAFCGEDRKHDGIIPEWSVRENLTLALLPHLTRAGIVRRDEQSRVVTEFIRRLDIRCAGEEQPIRELSGGNQQKVLLARWLCLNPDLLILDEPTRGIDVGAKRELQRLVSELAQDGLSVLMISSDLEELLEGCHRVTVLRDGHSVRTLSGDDLTEPNVLAAMAHDPASPVSVLPATAPHPHPGVPS
ncbi:sugar ABC transporter ATP-binding protein [Deinococcus aquiradiocola]|uniref:Sugar ABC transporter ATP-binding protein n=1 Tax=Deinococcus aquiradiocola TaxID=393059 RepID=A0A917PBY1_9DEIO|nr:sugar ABC transporter ATP-binding protein [Deinococcus aquiradiocola]GGJ69960.1 sugar ABC transporter ATP-binding protein [Deinococcus aquiradiocola]